MFLLYINIYQLNKINERDGCAPKEEIKHQLQNKKLSLLNQCFLYTTLKEFC